jgi:hypothetical protein
MKKHILNLSMSLLISHTIFPSAQEIVTKFRKSNHGFMITYHKGTKVCSQWETGRINCCEFVSHNGVNAYKQLPATEFARIEAEYNAQEQRKKEEMDRKIKESAAAAVVNAGAAGAGSGK